MCSECEEFLHLLQNYEARVTGSDSKHSALLKLFKNEIEVAVNYVQSWPNRQCMCIYRDVKNFDKFNLVVQSLICLVIHFLKNIRELIDDFKKVLDGKEVPKASTSQETTTEEKWTIQELEKLILFVSKAFLLNFPLYCAYKHGIHSRLDEIQQEEAKHLAIFCDLHDNEIPVYLLRNVSLFCNSSGFLAMMTAFENADLPITTSHAITVTISNVKLWLNYRCIIQLFVPIRSKVLQYMCKLPDQDLRTSIARSMADFVWSSVRDPLDSSFNFDIEGLELAFKYFNSTTLTMRLAGMAQINAHINLFNEICTTETVGEIEIVGQKLGDWLTENQIIGHLFGPNLHVEVVKQSQVVLNFLAVENQITEEHLNLIWQAAQLKHCSKPIYDILPSLVKNLAAKPSMHLYSLLCKLDAKEHTEQSIFIASALIKLIWTRDCGSIVKLANETNATASSSESVSMDGSITEEENPDDSGSSRNGMAIDVDGTGGVSDSGAPPCKQPRKKKSSVSPGEERKQTSKEDVTQPTMEKMSQAAALNAAKLQERRIVKKSHQQSSSDEDEDDEEDDDEEDMAEAQSSLISKNKKVRKRRNNERMFGVGKINAEMADVLWGDSHSDGEAINDSDDQVHNSVMKHLPVEGPYVRLLTNSAITDFLNEQDNDNGSYSSPMSNKSEKNMADFDDDDSPCEEEIAQLVESSGIIPKYSAAFNALREKHNHERKEKEQDLSTGATKVDPNGFPIFRVSEVCQPGKTLLWDLLQDNKIGQLGEALAIEAEKALGTLLCFSTDKTLRSVFIQGCLQNLASNKSVIVSLRLLPKLFASFQQFRTGGTYEITLWAERQHKMMHHFFSNIKYYANTYKNPEKLILNANSQPMYSHMTQVSVRLQFLSSVYSSLGSPKPFRLSIDQVDALWEWLAHDPECADCLFAWLQCQAKGIDQHALDVGALQHIYLKKLPEVQPEEFTMIALGLFQQLCSLARIAIHNDQTVIACSANITGMDHLWKIALRAHNTEVSLASIQYINSFYMGQKLRFEHEFVSTCMDHLIQAADDLKKPERQEYALMCVQRGLMLLNTHLETFRRRYAFHIRRWAMEGKEIGTFSNLRNESQGPTIRIILQPAGLSEKSVLHLHANDLVAELKAEISKWWEHLQGENQSTGATAPVLGYLLSEGPLRIITQGQELTSDYDDRPLGEVGFKDNQIVYVSLGGRGARRKEPTDHPTLQPPPPKENLPTVLLLQPCYFEELFNLMQILGDMRSKGKANTKAQLFSRRVWDILAILPTNPNMMNAFRDLEEDIKFIDEGTDDEKQTVKNKLKFLLCPSSLQKFMYSLHIIENLATKCTVKSPVKNKTAKKSESEKMKITEIVDEKEEEVKEEVQQEVPSSSTSMLASVEWSEVFIKVGGVKHLYEIFLSGVLQSSSHPDDKYNEWRHDCLGCMLRIIFILGFHEIRPDDLTLVIAKPYDFMLEMMDVPMCLKQLSSILNDEANYHHINQLQLRTGFWARAQVIQYVMSILVSFVHFCNDAQKILWTNTEYYDWLQKFILDDPEPSVRREICAGLYRISLGNSNKNNYELLTPLLQKLVIFLDVAEKMTVQHQNTHLVNDECKEPYGPACRDYFWLLARLVDTLTPKLVKESLENPQGSALDIEKLCFYVSRSILNRDYYEARHGFTDDGLIGLLNLLSNLIKYDPPFKFSADALNLLEHLFKFLFELPSPQNRERPKCKSQTSRAAAYDLIVELCKTSANNFKFLHTKLIEQHRPGPHAPYPWDYWPRDDVRSDCGYVGLTNLGATCYMASCIQHLFMMPQAREAVLRIPPEASQKHTATLHELQRMFAYLAESERKSYNPRSFCRVYQMDHQPLNTGEQKDMAEFFIDLVSKLEEMTPDLKVLIKRLFCGTLSNNVVSLDCEHVSQTGEEFYTVRCQVADMRNLQESLDEVTVKDTLEGDNMYTCSQCGKKVRAEKRACFKKLPQILCFNTMRYTFNMVTMLKEKVNTHFSFPMRLDMSAYVEKTLMSNKNLDKGDEGKGCEGENDEDIFSECYEYELVGVTVHTGTADGGHYYSFIKERYENSNHKERWFLFNDAEVKPFDPAQIAAECFGGEMTSKTYDSVTEKYLDFSFEKTNSAYMLFYERRVPEHIRNRLQKTSKSLEDKIPVPSTSKEGVSSLDESIVNDNVNVSEPDSSNKCDIESKNSFKSPSSPTPSQTTATPIRKSLLSKSLEEWIWQDNRNFLQDRNIFEHTYFNFMWQICGHVPQTLLLQTDVTCLAAQLSISFFIETFIHAKEKPTMVLWVEHLTKQFNASQEACEWFLTHMSTEPWWPLQVLIQCPNQMVRQMFQRLVIHVIQRLRPNHYSMYLQPEAEDGDDHDADIVGNASCITRFIKSLILLMEHGAKAHLRHLSEFFGLLFEFSRMGDEETLFLLRINIIKCIADFYLGHKNSDNNESNSDNEDNSSDEAVPIDKTRPASLDKMIALVATLVERSRGPDFRLHLSPKDYNAIAGGKGFPFLYQQIKDNINPHQSRNLIHALCRWDERLANQIITMLFASVIKHTELCGPFFKLLSLLTESQVGPSGLPCFSQLVLQRIWEAAEYCPQSALDWLATQAPRNKVAHAWIFQSAENWVENFLMAHNNSRVRNAAAYLLVSLVPSQSFRASFRNHSLHKLNNNSQRELSNDAQIVLHNIITILLRLLRAARAFTDIGIHGTTKLTAYFNLITYCMISKTEKIMVGPYMRCLWDLFHPRLSEPSVPAHHNKHALLTFWYHVTNDCTENATIITNSPEITKNIAFNYILADHDDGEIVTYNRAMLPAYYGLLRVCCQQSRALTRQLAAHQNLQWAFKNITPHPTQYPAAVEELFKLMSLFAERQPESSEIEQQEINNFRRTTLSAYLSGLDARVSWSTLINALKILVDNDEDRLFVVYNGGIEMCFEALHTLHSMFHEATACHVNGDLMELLTEMLPLISALRVEILNDSKSKNRKPIILKGLSDALKRLATFLNTFNAPELRHLAVDVLKELVRTPTLEAIQILYPLFTHSHYLAQNSPTNIGPLGPFFPRPGIKISHYNFGKNEPRPPRPMVQMSIPHGQLIQRGVDKEYDLMVADFYLPYHEFIDVMMRSAVANNIFGESLIKLSCLVATEAIPLHFNLFAKFWIGMYANPSCTKYVELLISSQNLVDYVDLLLKKERQSLNDSIIRNFMEFFYPKIASRLAIPRIIEIIGCSLIYKEDLDELCGDLHAIRLIAQLSSIPPSVRKPLKDALNEVLRARSALDFDKDDTPPKKKAKVTESSESNPEETPEKENSCENPTPSTSNAEEPKSEENITEIEAPKESPKATGSGIESTEKSELNGESLPSKEEVDMEFSIKGLSTEETQKCFQRTINNFIRAILGIITAQDEPPPDPHENDTSIPEEPAATVSTEEPLESSSASVQSEVPENTSSDLSPSKVN
ncbi:USP34 family protein [Megaselia abdita]